MNFRSILYVIIYKWSRFINAPAIFLNHVKLKKGVHIRGKVYFKTVGRRGASIFVGEKVNINSSLASDPIGGDTRTILYTRHNGTIAIGNYVGLSNTTIVSETSVTIGEWTNIGGGTKIYDTDFHSLDPDIRYVDDSFVKTKPIVIGSRVFIGGHSIILKGVTIGDGAVIGAGSVVTSNIPANEIWAGNPAKFIKKVK